MSTGKNGYQFVPLSLDNLDAVGALLMGMLQTSRETAIEYLRWKYLDCPVVEVPSAFVAEAADEPVAFRGFFPSRFSCNGHVVRVVSPANAFVHPAHRRRGLFLQLTSFAQQELAKTEDLFLSLSSNEKSSAGYRKMGWLPICKREFYDCFRPLSLLRYALMPKAPPRVLLESLVDRASDIADLYDQFSLFGNRETGNRLSPYFDRDYITWRYSGPNTLYVAIPVVENNRLEAFCVCHVNPRYAVVLDFHCRESARRVPMLRSVVRAMKKHCRVPCLRFAAYSFLDCDDRSVLARQGCVRMTRLISIARRREDLENLVFPVTDTGDESDWIIDGTDVRDVANWELWPFCCDGY